MHRSALPDWRRFGSQEEQEQAAGASPAPTCRAPPYGKRVSSGFVPRAPEDFGDGGAYPEIHVAQYPMGLGRKVGAANPASEPSSPRYGANTA